MLGRRSILLMARAFVLLAVVSVACGGDTDGTSSDSAVQPASPTAPVSKATPESKSEAPELRATTEAASPEETAVPEPAAPTATVVTPESAQAGASTKPLAGLTGSEPLAPELIETGKWINSEPFTLEEQRGKVVLIDFWTYTCVNCIRTYPYLRSWYEKYADKGLVILGVHTPEFEFEKIHENVVEAAERSDLRYPIVQDNEYGTWTAFNNRIWPAKYLIDKDGYIRYTHFGEGDYHETELAIRQLLIEAGADVSHVPDETAPAPEYASSALGDDPAINHTRELYAGYERNYGALQSGRVAPYILHREYYEKVDTDILYDDPYDDPVETTPGEHPNHFLFLKGLWRNEAESLVHARVTESYEDYIAIRFYATSVNAVMAPTSPDEVSVRVTIDDRPLASDEAGWDVMFDNDGNSFVLVDEERMYYLVNMDAFSGHDLKLGSNSMFSLFAFTFGAYLGGEPER